uniref:Pentatricopeptide repeat-containing protein n=1 Tax=Fagus sylvatica TaxID=28930 RepID=A0A2N9I6P5_FAGSY
MKSLSQSLKTLLTNGLYPQALKASLPNPNLTDQTYALFIKSGHSLEPYLSTTLISHFSKLGDFSRASKFLFETPNPDTVTFNALISGFARFRQPRPVFELFNTLRHLGLEPDVFTLSSLVKACGSLEENEAAHGVCLRMGFGSGAYLVSGFVENYATAGDVEKAEKCFGECLVMDNVVWTAMVCGYVWNGEFEKGKVVFVEMRGLGLELNEFSLTGVLGALFNVREGEQVHGIGVKMGLLCGGMKHLSNAIMSMYCKCGNKVAAVKMFDEIPDPDVVSWTERIGAACDGVEALELFKVLHFEGLEMNEYTMINFLSSIAGLRLLNSVRQVQALCQKVGLLQVICVCNALLSMFGKCGRMDDARRIFDDMLQRDSVSWNSLISGYTENGFSSQALEVFFQMHDLSLQPNEYTLASILEVVSNFNSVMQAMQIHSHMIKCGFMLDDSMVSCLIKTYGKCSGIDEAKEILSEINKINVATSQCYGYCFCLFLVVMLMLSIYLVQGRVLHSLCLKFGFDQDSFVESAVIDMYCKCGSIGDAKKAFRITSKDNLAAWNAMIMGYAQHGCFHEVSEIFDKMCKSGIEPDEITFLGVLTSCCHAGLVREANAYLNSMLELHGVIPHLEHYACMVDLLGRVGLLEDAKRTIDQMPIHPDAHIWQILLSACNIHGNVVLGNIAASKLLELQPENESAYLLLSNLYASVGMWNDVGKLRKQMKEKVVRKEPGSSWIQVGGSMHYFFAGNMSHPEIKEIYMELIKLYEQMLVSPKLDQNNAFLMET